MEALLVSSFASYGVSTLMKLIVEAIRSIRGNRELFKEMEALLERMKHVAAKIEQQKDLDVTVTNWNEALRIQLVMAKAGVLEHDRLTFSKLALLKRRHVRKKVIKVTASLKALASEAAAVTLGLHSQSWGDSRPTSPIPELIRNSSGDRSSKTTVSPYESRWPSSIGKSFGDGSSEEEDEEEELIHTIRNSSGDRSSKTTVSPYESRWPSSIGKSFGDGSSDSMAIVSGNGNHIYNSGHNSSIIMSGNGNHIYNSGHNSNIIMSGNGNRSYNSGHNSNMIISSNGIYSYNSGYNSNTIKGVNGDYIYQSPYSNSTIICRNSSKTVMCKVGSSQVLIGTV